MIKDKKLIERRQGIRDGIKALELKNAEWFMRQSQLMALCGVTFFDSAEGITEALNKYKTEEATKPFYEDLERLGKEIKAIKQALNKLI